MLVVNLFGGPGVGKSTTAAMLFAHYKRRGIQVELVREQAKDMLYQGLDLPSNQVLILAKQYQLLKDIERAGTKLAISDSALRLGLLYSRNLPFYPEMEAFVLSLCREFTELDILLKRAVPYQTHGRVQGTEEDARKIDESIAGPFNLELPDPTPASVIAAVDRLVFERVTR